MTEGASENAISIEQESAEKFWHLWRGLRSAFLIAVVILIFAVSFKAREYDVYLDAVYGRAIASGSLASVDEAAPMRSPSPTSGWLWWLLAYSLVRIWGVMAVRALAALLVAAGFAALVAVLSRRVAVVFAGLLVVAAVYLSERYFAPGSQAAGIFLFCALTALILGNLHSARRRIWWAVPLVVIYVNVDISWPAGVAVCVAGAAAAVLSGAERKWEKTAALLIAVVATLANPDLVSAWKIVRVAPVPARSTLAYLWPALAPAAEGKGIVLTVLVAAGLVTFLSRSLEGFVLALTAVLIAVSGAASANFAMLSAAAFAALAAGLGPLMARLPDLAGGGAGAFIDRWVRPVFGPAADSADDRQGDERDWGRLRAVYGLSALLAAVALAAAMTLVARTAGELKGAPAGPAVPEKAVAFLAERSRSSQPLAGGCCLTDPLWAGYLLWQAGTGPAATSSTGEGLSVAASTRPFAVTVPAVNVAAWAFGGAKWPDREMASPFAFLDRWQVDLVLAPVEWQWSGAFRRGWKVVYWDDVSAVFVRETDETAALLRENDENLTYPPYLWYTAAVENLGEIERLLTERLEKEGESAYAQYGLAVCAFVQKKYDVATGYLAFAIAAKDDFASAWHLRADIYRIQGQDAQAIAAYEQAVRHKSDDALALVQMGNLLLKRGDFVLGLNALRRAQAADDKKPQLDSIRPGLRSELDEQIRKMLSPQRPAPAPAAPDVQPAQESREGASEDQAQPAEGNPGL